MMRGWLVGASMVGLALAPATAQMRDPTMAPIQAGLDAPGVLSANAAMGAGALTPGAIALVVRDGKSHVMLGTRLYAVGDRLGAATITRIEETAVWLREAGVVRKIPLFEAVERRATPASAAVSAASAPRKTNPSKKKRPTHAKQAP